MNERGKEKEKKRKKERKERKKEKKEIWWLDVGIVEKDANRIIIIFL